MGFDLFEKVNLNDFIAGGDLRAIDLRFLKIDLYDCQILCHTRHPQKDNLMWQKVLVEKL